MSQDIQSAEQQFLHDIGSHTGLTITVGVILLLLGLLAMGTPLVAGLSQTLIVGIVLIFSGISQIIFSFKTGRWIINLLLGLLTTIVGIYMVMNPGVALVTLTIFLTGYLVVSGIFEILMSFQVRPAKGWGWLLFTGIVSILLGIMIWNQFPLSGVWAIGILIGLRLFFSGCSFIMFGLAARRTVKTLAKET